MSLCHCSPHQHQNPDGECAAWTLTDGFVGRCGFEVASLDDLGRQLTGGRVVDETQEDLW